MSNLKEMAMYHAAVGHLEKILGQQESFWIQFRGQYIIAVACARAEFGRADMGKNQPYKEFGLKGEKAFQELKEWVIENYPWPSKKYNPPDFEKKAQGSTPDIKAAGNFLRSVRRSRNEDQANVGSRAKPSWNSSSISDIELGKKKTLDKYLPRIVQAYQLSDSQEETLRYFLGLSVP